MDTNDVKERTREFLGKYIARPIEEDEDLFASGLVNSLFAMQLLLFVEKEFGIRVENEDMDVRNFRSRTAIVTFVARKQSTLAAGGVRA